MLKKKIQLHTRIVPKCADVDYAHVIIPVKELATEKTVVLASLPANSAASIRNVPCAATNHVHHALRDAHGSASIEGDVLCKSNAIKPTELVLTIFPSQAVFRAL